MAYSGRNAETGGGQPAWPGALPRYFEVIAMRGNGLVLASWGGAAVAVGALLPFVANVQTTVDGTSFATGFGINAAGRFASFLFGLLLTGLAVWTRYRPVFRRRIAIASLITSVLGLAGYCLFTLVGIVGVSTQDGYSDPAQVSWDPSIGVLLSVGGCAAGLVAAVVMLRTSPPSLSEPR